MTPIATVRYLANGYLLTTTNPPAGIAATIYAATLPEVIFWLDQIFNPPT